MNLNFKKWCNKYIIIFLLFLCFIFLLYNLFVKSYEGFNESSLSNIKKWYFKKSLNWYKIKKGVDVIKFSDTGFNIDKPEISIIFLLNNLTGKPYWRNIFHFTNTDHACCEKGDRVPAMWVSPDNTNNFHITVSTEKNGNDWFNTTNNLPFGIPVFIGIVVNDTTIKYYINNSLAMTKQYDSTILKRNSSTKLYIGNPWEHADNILIKDFTIYDGALSSDQINEIYSSLTDINPFKNDDTNNNGVTFTIYDGYFKDDLSFFTNAEKLFSGRANNFQNIRNATEEYIQVDKDELYSVIWEGYFLPDMDGKWTFGLNSDDSSYMWIGEKQEGYFTNNANINNNGLHGMVLVTCDEVLTKGRYYPIKIIFGQNYGGADLQFFYSINNSEKIYDFNGKLFKKPVINSSNITLHDVHVPLPANTNTSGGIIFESS